MQSEHRARAGSQVSYAPFQSKLSLGLQLHFNCRRSFSVVGQCVNGTCQYLEKLETLEDFLGAANSPYVVEEMQFVFR